MRDLLLHHFFLLVVVFSRLQLFFKIHLSVLPLLFNVIFARAQLRSLGLFCYRQW